MDRRALLLRAGKERLEKFKQKRRATPPASSTAAAPAVRAATTTTTATHRSNQSSDAGTASAPSAALRAPVAPPPLSDVSTNVGAASGVTAAGHVTVPAAVGGTFSSFGAKPGPPPAAAAAAAAAAAPEPQPGPETALPTSAALSHVLFSACTASSTAPPSSLDPSLVSMDEVLKLQTTVSMLEARLSDASNAPDREPVAVAQHLTDLLSQYRAYSHRLRSFVASQGKHMEEMKQAELDLSTKAFAKQQRREAELEEEMHAKDVQFQSDIQRLMDRVSAAEMENAELKDAASRAARLQETLVTSEEETAAELARTRGMATIDTNFVSMDAVLDLKAAVETKERQLTAMKTAASKSNGVTVGLGEEYGGLVAEYRSYAVSLFSMMNAMKTHIDEIKQAELEMSTKDLAEQRRRESAIDKELAEQATEFNARLAEVQARLDAATAATATKAKELEEATSQLTKASSLIHATRSKNAELSAELELAMESNAELSHDLEITRQDAQQEVVDLRERLEADHEAALEDARERLEEEAQQSALLQDRVSEMHVEIQALQNSRDTAQAAAADTQAELASAMQEKGRALDQLEEDLAAAHKEQVEELEATADELTEKLGFAQQRFAELSAQHAAVQDELARNKLNSAMQADATSMQLEQRVNDLDSQLRGEQATHTQTKLEVNALTAQLEQARARVAEVDAAREQLARRNEAMGEEVAGLAQDKTALEGLSRALVSEVYALRVRAGVTTWVTADLTSAMRGPSDPAGAAATTVHVTRGGGAAGGAGFATAVPSPDLARSVMPETPVDTVGGDPAMSLSVLFGESLAVRTPQKVRDLSASLRRSRVDVHSLMMDAAAAEEDLSGEGSQRKLGFEDLASPEEVVDGGAKPDDDDGDVDDDGGAAAAKAALADAQVQIDHLETVVERCHTDHMALQSQFEAKCRELEAALTRVTALEADADSMQARVMDVSDGRAALEAERDDLLAQVSDGALKVSELQLEVSELHAAAQAAEASAHAATRNADAVLAELQSRLASTTTQYEQSTAQVAKLQAEVDHMSAALKTTQSSAENDVVAAQKDRAALHSAQAQLADLQTAHTALQANYRTAQDQLSDAQSQMAALTSERDRLNASIESIEATATDDVRKAMHMTRKLKDRVDELQRTNDALQADCSSAQSSVAALTSSRDALQASIDSIQAGATTDVQQAMDTARQAQDKLRQAQAEQAATQTQLTTLNAQYLEAMSTGEQAAREAFDLRQQMTDMEARAARHSDALDAAMDKANAASRDRDARAAEAQAAFAKATDLSAQLESVSGDLQSALQQLADAQSAGVALRAEASALQSNVDDLTAQLGETKTAHAALAAQHDDLQATLASDRAAASEATLTVQQLQSEVDSLTSQLTTKVEACESLEASLERTQTHLRQAETNRAELAAQLSEGTATAATELVAAQATIQDLQHRESQLHADLRDAAAQADARLKDRGQQVAELKAKLAVLERDVADAQQAAGDAASRADTHVGRITQLEDALASSRRDMDGLRESLRSAETDRDSAVLSIQRLETAVSGLRQELDRKSDATQRLQSQLETAQQVATDKLTAAEASHSTLQAQLASYRDATVVAERRAEQAEAAKDSVGSQLRDAVARAEKVEDARDKLLMQMSKLGASKEHEAALASQRQSEQQAQVTKLQAALESATAELAAAARDTNDPQTSETDAVRDAVARAEKAEDASGKLLMRMGTLRATLEHEAALASQRQSEQQAQVTKLQAALESATAELAAARDTNDQLRGRLQQQASNDVASAELAALQAQNEALSLRATDAEAELVTQRGHVARMTDVVGTMKDQLASLGDHAAGLSRDKAHAVARGKELQAEVEALQARLGDVSKQMSKAEEGLRRAEGALSMKLSFDRRRAEDDDGGDDDDGGGDGGGDGGNTAPQREPVPTLHQTELWDMEKRLLHERLAEAHNLHDAQSQELSAARDRIQLLEDRSDTAASQLSSLHTLEEERRQLQDQLTQMQRERLQATRHQRVQEDMWNEELRLLERQNAQLQESLTRTAATADRAAGWAKAAEERLHALVSTRGDDAVDATAALRQLLAERGTRPVSPRIEDGPTATATTTATATATATATDAAAAGAVSAPSDAHSVELQVLRTDLSRLRQERSSLERSVRTLTTSRQELQDQLSSTKHQLSSSMNRVAELEAELQAMARAADLNERRFEDEKAQFRKHLAARASEIHSLRSQVNRQKQELKYRVTQLEDKAWHLAHVQRLRKSSRRGGDDRGDDRRHHGSDAHTASPASASTPQHTMSVAPGAVDATPAVRVTQSPMYVEPGAGGGGGGASRASASRRTKTATTTSMSSSTAKHSSSGSRRRRGTAGTHSVHRVQLLSDSASPASSPEFLRQMVTEASPPRRPASAHHNRRR